MLRRHNSQKRRGTVFVFAVLIMVIILGFAALVVDIGYLANSRSELQRSADAAALSASWEYAQALAHGSDAEASAEIALAAVNSVAAENAVCKGSLEVDANDIRMGYLSDYTDRVTPLDTSDPDIVNAVEVTVRRNSSLNGRVPFFFANIFGMQGADAEASATAMLLRDIRGFQAPADGSNIQMLPFALDHPSYQEMMDGASTDEWTWNAETQQVQTGPDGLFEVNLYPKGNGSPGNRGTVDIGSSNNSTADIARQIVNGISAEDLEYHDGELRLDDNNELLLNGDTGISAGVKDELASIIGDPRIIPVFQEVNGPGNNAEYTITKFVGVRLLEVKLTGSKNSKRVIIQPCPIIVNGVIPSTSVGTSDQIFAPIVLVR